MFLMSHVRVALQWLAKPEVRRAIHAVSVYQLPWEPCSDVLNYTLDVPIDVIDVHEELLGAGLRVLVYSGDHGEIISGGQV